MGSGKRPVEAEELDLVPIMNLVTILIPFLLMASSFVSLAVIDSTLPAIGAPPTEQTDEPEEALNLQIIITSRGFTLAGGDDSLKPVAAEGEEPEPTVPCKKQGCPTPDAYDTAELSRMLGDLKKRWQDEENVVLVPEASIPYDVLILTMDAAREDASSHEELFPYVVIAGGAE